MTQNTGVTDNTTSLLPQLTAVLKYWHADGIITNDDLLATGKENLEVLIGKLKQQAHQHDHRGNRLRASRDILQQPYSKLVTLIREIPLTPADLKDYDCYGTLRKVPANSKYDKGDSNYSLCGWCTHSTGTCLGTATVDGSCDILRDGMLSREVLVDTPCQLFQLPRTELDRGAQACDRGAAVEDQDIETIHYLIEQVTLLLNQAVSRPLFPENRHWSHFNVGDTVIAWMSPMKSEEKLVTAPFTLGRVVNGYRHHDGLVSQRSDFKLHSGECENGHGTYCSDRRADIIKLDDFLALRALARAAKGQEDVSATTTQAEAFLRIWRAQASKHNFDSTAHLQELEEGEVLGL